MPGLAFSASSFFWKANFASSPASHWLLDQLDVLLGWGKRNPRNPLMWRYRSSIAPILTSFVAVRTNGDPAELVLLRR